MTCQDQVPSYLLAPISPNPAIIAFPSPLAKPLNLYSPGLPGVIFGDEAAGRVNRDCPARRYDWMGAVYTRAWDIGGLLGFRGV